MTDEVISWRHAAVLRTLAQPSSALTAIWRLTDEIPMQVRLYIVSMMDLPLQPKRPQPSGVAEHGPVASTILGNEAWDRGSHDPLAGCSSGGVCA